MFLNEYINELSEGTENKDIQYMILLENNEDLIFEEFFSIFNDEEQKYIFESDDNLFGDIIFKGLYPLITEDKEELMNENLVTEGIIGKVKNMLNTFQKKALKEYQKNRGNLQNTKNQIEKSKNFKNDCQSKCEETQKSNKKVIECKTKCLKQAFYMRIKPALKAGCEIIKKQKNSKKVCSADGVLKKPLKGKEKQNLKNRLKKARKSKKSIKSKMKKTDSKIL